MLLLLRYTTLSRKTSVAALLALRFQTQKHLWAETMGRANRRLKQHCDNAFVTNIVFAAAKTSVVPSSSSDAPEVLLVRKRSVSNKCFICAKAKRQQQMFYLCESEASATNVLSVRKRSVSNKCFICAKAKRQQQMFLSVRKRSVSNKASSWNGNQLYVMMMGYIFSLG